MDVWRRNVRRHRKQERRARRKYVKDVKLLKYLVKRQKKRFSAEGEVHELDPFPEAD